MSTKVLERAAIKRSLDPRIACALVLGLVFLCGAAAGALVMDLGVHPHARIPVFDNPTAKTVYFDRLQKELNLTPEQSEQVQSVLNDFWQYYRTVLSDSKQRVEQLLNDEQKQKFERLLQQQLPH